MNRSILIFEIGWLIMVISLLGSGCESSGSGPMSLGELDSLHLLSLDSTKLQLTQQDRRPSLMAVVFNPWCEHCQAEAMQIYLNMSQLKDVTVLMIGMVQMKSIKEFSTRYGLHNFKNVIFAYTSPVAAYNLLGAYNLPHIRLYNADLKPVEDFSGPNTVKQVIAKIRENQTGK